eukprot:ANDGO_06236.mRNA.1 Triacylglycerol lipase SDP1
MMASLFSVLALPFKVFWTCVLFLFELADSRKSESNKRKSFIYRMQNAKSFEDWRENASSLDAMDGLDKWKRFDACVLFDHRIVAHRLLMLRFLRLDLSRYAAPDHTDCVECLSSVEATPTRASSPAPRDDVLTSYGVTESFRLFYSDVLEDLRDERELKQLMFSLREGLDRNIGNIGNPQLYVHSRCGTKNLVELYISHVCALLRRLARESAGLHLDAESDADGGVDSFSLSPATKTVLRNNLLRYHALLLEKLAFFREASAAHGKTALLLSGGASLGVFHLGVLKALFEHGVLPQTISGSSVGSIIAALICCRSNPELEELFDSFDGSMARTQHVPSMKTNRFSSLRLDAFEELENEPLSKPSNSSEYSFGMDSPGSSSPPRFGVPPSIQRKFMRLLTRGVLMDISRLIDVIRINIGDITFAEAFERTGRNLNITVSSPSGSEIPRLLNHLTAPHVLVWSAAAASCSLPGVFEPVEVLARHPDGRILSWHPGSVRWTDGSLAADLPIARLSEMFNINHFIVSQVNPHVLPFLLFHTQDRDHFRRKTMNASAGFFVVVLLRRLLLLAVHAASRVLIEGWHALQFLRLVDTPHAGDRDDNHFIPDSVRETIDMLDFGTPRQLGVFQKLKWLMLGELKFRLLQFFALGMMPQKLSFLESLISQRYQGDITITPESQGLRDYAAMLSNPTHEFIHKWTVQGQRRTWPKISRIRNQTLVEMTLQSGLNSVIRQVRQLERYIRFLEDEHP